MKTPALGLLQATVLTLLGSVTLAQVPGPDAQFLNRDAAARAQEFEAKSAAFQRFVERVPGEWLTRWCPATGTPKQVFGPGVTVGTWRGNSLEEARRHAHLLLLQEQELLGLGASEFRESIGTRMGRTWCFVFDQYYRGIPVMRGRADVRVHMVGKVSMFGSVAWQIPGDFVTVPQLSELAARQIAWQKLGKVPPANHQPGGDRKSRLVIWGDQHATGLAPVRLAWEIPVTAIEANGDGPAGRYIVDAITGDQLEYINDKHECFKGCKFRSHKTEREPTGPAFAIPGVTATATPESTAPESTAKVDGPVLNATGVVMAWVRTGVGASGPLSNVPLANLEINVSGVGTVFTDSTGSFTVTVAAPTPVTLDLIGEHTQRVGGTNAPQVTGVLNPGTTTTFQFLWGSAPPDFASHTGAYYWTDAVNEYARSVLGNTSQINSLDSVVPTVNLNNTCNAYYINNTINFYNAGGGCNNSAFSSVVAHEWGHGLDDFYGGISQTNGLSEGWADILSMYLLDDAVIGRDFFTQGGFIRAGTNVRQYPNGGGVHDQGESFMGFAWKLRQRLAQTLPSRAAAITLTEDIVLGTIVANANDQQAAVLEVFLADDNDANLNNGTPHDRELIYACNQHALPFPGNSTYTTTNDTCATAITVQNGLNGPFTSSGATNSGIAWPCGNGGKDVWFKYVSTNFGTLTATTCYNAAFDTVIQIMSGDCGSLSSVGCDDDNCAAFAPQSSLTVTVTPGTYYIRVGGKNSVGGSFNLRIDGPTGNPAATTQYGAGCYAESKAFYEQFASTSAFDLNNTNMQLFSLGNAYFALSGGAFVAPSGSATTLTLTDDDEATVNLSGSFAYPGGATSSLVVCSNGFVSVATGNGTSATPDAAGWLGSTEPRWGMWHNFDPSAAGSGQVKFEEVNGIAYITWDGVYTAGTTTPSTWQMQFELAAGTVTYAWQTVGGTTEPALVGYAHTTPNLDLGSMDISAELPGTFTTSGQNMLGLTLSTTPPQLGTNVVFTTINYPVGSALGFQVMSFTRHDPGLPLAALGMPGCFQYVNSDVSVVVVPVSSQSTFSGPIPNSNGLMGVRFNAQTFALAPGANTIGLVSSNGVHLVIGT
ncbi:MAG: hypothetical protein NXI31_21920 [bacterium]|nr:hypothetical protein [bacterium]